MRCNEDRNLWKTSIFESDTHRLISDGVRHASEIRIVKNQYIRNARIACCILFYVPSRWPLSGKSLPDTGAYRRFW